MVYEAMDCFLLQAQNGYSLGPPGLPGGSCGGEPLPGSSSSPGGGMSGGFSGGGGSGSGSGGNTNSLLHQVFDGDGRVVTEVVSDVAAPGGSPTCPPCGSQ